MPIPLLIPAIIGASTVAGLVTPFFFPTEQDKATIELNQKLKDGNFTLVKNQEKIKVPDFNSKLSKTVDTVKQQLKKPENTLFIVLALIAVVLVVLR